jgi:xanthine dehydrogenase YagT iron-sulfur-binding subunit
MVVPAMVSAQQTQPTAPSTGAMETLQGEVAVELNVNGKNMALKVEPRTTLLDALRNRANPPLTGAKLVCDRGNCGACTMIVDDKLVYACLQLAVDMRGKRIRTVEGLSSGEGASNTTQLSPLQQSFCEHDASM